jgi:hypothetical protein
MGLPRKQVIPTINLTPEKILFQRREQLLEYITEDGTYLPKSLLHADLDRGFLDFVKEDLETIVEGKIIPPVDIIITTQNWSQFTQTWDFQDLNGNPQLPFITTVRNPDVKYGSNPAIIYNIPNRKEYFYSAVPTWNGNVKGMDIYKIPQPVPVDITYNVKLLSNRMRELNEFNKNVIQTFASRQAYRKINGHYIPIILNNISDESAVDVGRRRFYIQNYEFTMLAFLLDEEEFEVAPAVSRVFNAFEVNLTQKKSRRNRFPENPDEIQKNILFNPGVTTRSILVDYTGDFFLLGNDNVESSEIYINGDFYGSNVNLIQVNTNDILRIDIVSSDPSLESKLEYGIKLL